MARPMSALRVALSAELVDGPGTCRELWRRLGCAWLLEQVRIALRNMVSAGECELAPPVRVPGVRRPVPVYQRACASESENANSEDDDGCGIHDRIACWAGLSKAPAIRARQPMEAAM